MKTLWLIPFLFSALAHGQMLQSAVSSCNAFPTPAAGGAVYNSATITGWGVSLLTLTTSNTFGPACINTGTTLIENSGSAADHTAQSSFSYTMTAKAYHLTFYGKSLGRNILVQFKNAAFSSTASVGINLAACTVNIAAAVSGGNFTSPSATIVNRGNQWCYIDFTFTGYSDTGSTIIFYPLSGTTDFYAGNGTSGIGIWGVDFR